MELILLEKVKNLGNLGDKVRVKPGYGRNYLVPQGKAAPATAANLADFEKRRADLEARHAATLAAAEARRAALDGQEITLSVNASPEGKLYGSVGPREIAEALSARGLKVEKSEVIMADGPIRAVGEAAVSLALHADVSVSVKVIVQALCSPPAPVTTTGAAAPVVVCAPMSQPLRRGRAKSRTAYPHSCPLPSRRDGVHHRRRPRMACRATSAQVLVAE